VLKLADFEVGVMRFCAVVQVWFVFGTGWSCTKKAYL
jgi:hypothetical protein